MKVILNLFVAIIVVAFGLFSTSCGRQHEDEYLVHQKIAINIHSNGVIVLKMSKLVGNHVVGIRCSEDVWKTLTNNQEKIHVKITYADRQSANVFALEPGLKGTSCDHIASCLYLFEISAIGNVVVELSFPNVTINVPAEIIICQTPEETEQPY